ncbi:hypothetical protein BD413DRAFT_57642 [Trametes elegans]|nr:hypothetical protein BD413DRAFT_57642 [Trametes elegans]
MPWIRSRPRPEPNDDPLMNHRRHPDTHTSHQPATRAVAAPAAADVMRRLGATPASASPPRMRLRLSWHATSCNTATLRYYPLLPLPAYILIVRHTPRSAYLFISPRCIAHPLSALHSTLHLLPLRRIICIHIWPPPARPGRPFLHLPVRLHTAPLLTFAAHTHCIGLSHAGYPVPVFRSFVCLSCAPPFTLLPICSCVPPWVLSVLSSPVCA